MTGVLRSPEERHLIIGGTTKAATTSLFNYLGTHPAICASSVKETRFFLDGDYPLPSKYRAEAGLERYGEFFRSCHADQWRLDATPDYLYSPGTPGRLRESLPSLKLIFSLRNPITRVVSWFRYAKQTGRLAESVSLEAYVEAQLREEPGATIPQHLRSVEQGRYGRYLRPFFDLFGAEAIRVVFFEDIKTRPWTVLEILCAFADLSADFYGEYEFEIHNPTLALRSPMLHRAYMQIRFRVRHFTHHHRPVHGLLRALRRTFEPWYLRLNERRSAPLYMPEELVARLVAYYREDTLELERLLGTSLPWQSGVRPGTSVGAGDE